MPAAFDKMQRTILKNLISQYTQKNGKAPTGDAKKELEARSFAIATAAYKKKFGKSPREELVNGLVLTETADIELSESKNNEMTIKGTAIKVGKSRNGIIYTAAELRKAAPSFIGKPFLKDHNTSSVSSVMGKITNAYFDEQKQSIQFEARIDKNDPDAKKIQAGYVRTVSIGAGVEDLEEGDDGQIAKGIEGHELSLVVVPGVPGAEIASISEQLNMIKRGESMSEETKLDFATKEDLNTVQNSLKELKEILLAKAKEEPKKAEEKKDDGSKALLEELKSLKESVVKIKEESAKPKGTLNPDKIAEYENKFAGYSIERTGKGRLSICNEDAKINKYTGGNLAAVFSKR